MTFRDAGITKWSCFSKSMYKSNLTGTSDTRSFFSFIALNKCSRFCYTCLHRELVTIEKLSGGHREQKCMPFCYMFAYVS